MHGLTLVALLAASPLQDAAAKPAAAPAAAADGIRFELLKHTDRVERDGGYVRTQDVQVRLNSAQWVSVFGQLGTLYLEGYGEVQFENVAIDKSDGRRVPVTNPIVEDLNPYGVTATSLSADLRFKKITIPGLEPGDRLSYRIVQRQKPLAPGHVFGEIKLSPTPDSTPQTYELDLPRDAPIKVRLRTGLGVDWQAVPSASDRLVRRLVLKVPVPGPNAKPSKQELEGRSEPDVIFTSFDSWNDVTRWWWGISKERQAPDAAVTKEAESLVVAAKTPREKAEALHAFTSARIRYLNVSFGLGRMQPRRAPEVLANRYGDCKDKQALLAALATSVGLDVRPVLINSTRKSLRDDVPSPQQFDHVISVVRLGPKPEDWLWVDGTNPFAPPGHLVRNLRDKAALLVEANGDAIPVRTPKDLPFMSRQELTLKATLGADGVLKGHSVWTLRSDDEPVLRSAFALIPLERRAEALQSSIGQFWPGGKLANVTTSDPLAVDLPFRLEYDAEMSLAGGGVERRLSVPVFSMDLPEVDSDAAGGDPAASFGVRETTIRAEIELPESQQAEAPLSVALERPFGSFHSSYQRDGRTIKLERTLRLSKSEVAPDETASYQAFKNAIARDHSQSFVISGFAAATRTVTALSLRKEGTAALEQKELEKAVELLRKATELDPKVEDGFVDLGRALCDLKRYEDAASAFSRQIAQSPFDERAYAWRGFAFGRLGRSDESERDLRKQIEVTPFYVWPYQELGRLYSRQGRHSEATEVYEQAATLEPDGADNWLDLAQERIWAGHPEGARQPLGKATSLELADWRMIRAASLYRSIGEIGTAGHLAVEAAPSVADRLAKMGREDLDDGDTYWSKQLAEAWRLIGEAAMAANEFAKADKYLGAAWRLQLAPEAAWALGELREQQGRLADALEFWRLAVAAAGGTWNSALPADREQRISSACEKVQGPGGACQDSAQQSGAASRLTELRTVRLKGPVVAEVTEEVVLLGAADGRVEKFVNVSRKSPKDFDRQLASLDPVRISWPRPDEHGYKAVRHAVFTCFAATGCALVLDLPEQAAVVNLATRGSVRITDIEPKEGTTLKRGATVTVVAKIHYRVSDSKGSIQLLILKRPQDPTRPARVDPLAQSKLQPVVATEGDLTLTATFVAPMEPARIEFFAAPMMREVASASSWVKVE
jgi:tetratricopeptide (TPR) repeat protein